MKKIVFCLNIVLLALFMPTYSYTLDIPSHDFKIAKQKQLYTSNTAKVENLYFDACLLEEDNDDGSTSERDELASEKNSSITTFTTTNFPDHCLKGLWRNRYFLNFSQSDFIYFRALRL